MEFFNFVETFFFISLAITFVLIMMLVYHFKEQLLILEKKSETMFDIMNNIVKEMNSMKNRSISDIAISNNIPLSNIFSQFNPKTVVSDDDLYTDSDSDSESDDLNDNIDEELLILSDSITSNNDIKRINIEFNPNEIENINDIDILINEIEEKDEIKEVEETNEANEIDQPDETDETEEIKEINNEQQNDSIINESLNDSYKKLDINALRTLVVTKGLNVDTKKMKKNDLLKLLEQTV
jgi:hypothetical protein